jgi:hypothetical protein
MFKVQVSKLRKERNLTLNVEHGTLNGFNAPKGGNFEP